MVYTCYIGMLLSGRRLKDSGCTTLTSWTPTTESSDKDSWLIFIILYHCETYIMQYVHYTENIISARNCKTDMTIINQWIILKCVWHSLIWLYISYWIYCMLLRFPFHIPIWEYRIVHNSCHAHACSLIPMEDLLPCIVRVALKN